MTWEELHHISGVIVDITLLVGAVATVVKFRLLNVLAHRWRSELTCAHSEMDDGSTVFTADYTLHNSGPRVLHVQRVTLRLVGAKTEGPLLVPDESIVLAERVLLPSDPALKGLFWIESGERAIFPLRAKLPVLPTTVFILCAFDLQRRRAPAAFRGFYCKSMAKVSAASIASPGTGPMANSESAQSVSEPLE